MRFLRDFARAYVRALLGRKTAQKTSFCLGKATSGAGGANPEKTTLRPRAAVACRNFAVQTRRRTAASERSERGCLGESERSDRA